MPRIDQSGNVVPDAPYTANTRNPNYSADPANPSYRGGQFDTTDKILTALTAALATAGASGLFSGAAAAGGAGAAPLATSVPGSYATTAYGAGAFGVPGAGATGMASLGGLSAAGALGNGVNDTVDSLMGNGMVDGVDLGSAGVNGLPLAGGIGSKVLGGLGSVKGIGSLASLIPVLLAMNKNGGSGGGASSGMPTFADPLTNPNIQSLMQIEMGRQQRVDPLHQAVTQLAMSMLPKGAR